jgi:hypothetical protein
MKATTSFTFIVLWHHTIAEETQQTSAGGNGQWHHRHYLHTWSLYVSVPTWIWILVGFSAL